MRYADILALVVLPVGAKGFAPSLVHPARRSSVPETTQHHETRPRSRGPRPAPSLLRRTSPSLSAASAAAASPSSPAEYIMALFGVNKGESAKTGGKGKALEAELLSAIDGVQGRGRDVTPEQRSLVDKAVEALEEFGGVPDRASSPLVDGSWRLIFTTTPGTASPVQRSFVRVDGFAIYQDIDLFSEQAPPTVTNVVDFGTKVGQLRVTALASTPSRPMEGFVPRRGDGRFFGLNILGVSQTTPPKVSCDPSGRIDFQFDEAGFDFEALPFNIPYPVPFRLFGDEVKGWIDVTYLSERLRIARGNKGTLFVLQRPPPTA
ncbi:unnamed protein product [Pylaiella littoralis]